MTREEFIITLASGGAVLALIAIAWALGFRDAARLKSEDDVQRALVSYEPGAALASALIDARGGGALARLEDGRLAAVRAMADGFAVRIFAAGAARIKASRRGVTVTFADVGYPRLELEAAGAAPDWLAPLVEARA